MTATTAEMPATTSVAGEAMRPSAAPSVAMTGSPAAMDPTTMPTTSATGPRAATRLVTMPTTEVMAWNAPKPAATVARTGTMPSRLETSHEMTSATAWMTGASTDAAAETGPESFEASLPMDSMAAFAAGPMPWNTLATVSPRPDDAIAPPRSARPSSSVENDAGSAPRRPSTVDSNIERIESAMTGARPWMTDGRRVMAVTTISSRRGTMFEAAVMAESTSSPVSASMSAESSARPVTQFSQAARVMLMLPSMVVAASRAVVPAMFCFCWTRSIASTMSEKLSMLRSPARPMLLAYSLASEMRRCISSLVPP